MNVLCARWTAFRTTSRIPLCMDFTRRNVRWTSFAGPTDKSFKWESLLFRFDHSLVCGQHNRVWATAFHTSEPYLQKKKTRKPKIYPKKGIKKAETVIEVWEGMTVAQLAGALQKDSDHVFEVMLYVGNATQYDTPESAIKNAKIITEVVKKSGVRCTWIADPTIETIERADKDAVRRPPPNPEALVKRPPVVTIMGHIDHGKTTLLDTLRHTSVVSHEFGGITQHIGAFLVNVSSKGAITFLDTPGHAAFMAMRARGARVTDIVVLVVAADDGVMEQTAECIRLADEANVPVIVAINKMDKPQANIEFCKKTLLQHGLQLEDFGGDIQAVPISALRGDNVNTLVDAILAQAEQMELRGDPNGPVEGHVIESRTDVLRGKLSTAIVQRGTLRRGTCLVAGMAWAKVRAMYDDRGRPMESASPSTPVEIAGWRELPSAGDELLEVESEKRAHRVVQHRLQRKMDKKMDEDRIVVQTKAEEHLRVYREALAKRRAEGRFKSRRIGPREKEIKDDGSPRLAIVLKGDVDGSVEAILDVLVTYHSKECPLDIVHYGVGMLCDNDIVLGKAFDGIVYGFNVGALPSARGLAESSGVVVKEFNVIYRLVEDIREEISRRLPPIDCEEVLGEADVLEEFIINDGRRKVPVAGCRCVSGLLKKSAQFRLIRDRKIIHEGTLSSMRHLKGEVDCINKDVECGLKMTDEEIRFRRSDRIVCFQKKKVPQETDWQPGF